jgi:hypothetical protein
MIFPTKYTDPNLSLINSVYYIMKFLMESGTASVSELLDALTNSLTEDSRPLFEPSINLIFILGKIEYLDSLDSFRYIEGGTG